MSGTEQPWRVVVRRAEDGVVVEDWIEETLARAISTEASCWHTRACDPRWRDESWLVGIERFGCSGVGPDDERGLRRFLTVLRIAADEPAALRCCDVLRVVEAAADAGLVGFPGWLSALRPDLEAAVEEAASVVAEEAAARAFAEGHAAAQAALRG